MDPLPFAPGTLFSRIFHASPVAMSLTDLADDRYVDVNEAFAKLVEVGREQLLDPARTEEVRFYLLGTDIFSTHTKGNAPATAENGIQLRTARGELRHLISSYQIEEWEGRQYLLTIIQDLTAVKLTERALRSSQARFRHIFNSVPLPVFVYELESLRVLDLNPAATREYGYTREELMSLTMLDIRPLEDRLRFLDHVPTMPPETTAFGIWIHQKKDGTPMAMEVTGYALELDGRNARLAVCRNVTEQLQMEAALRASEERHRIIANVTNDVLWDVNLRTDEITFSEGMFDVFGYKLPRPVTVEWWIKRVHPAERDQVAQRFHEAIDGSDTEWTDTYRFRCREGRFSHVRDRGYIFREKDGTPTRMIGAMIDITRQIEVQEAAAQAAVEERRRLARDLHDAITQSLYSLSLLSEVARRRAEQGDMKATQEQIKRLGVLAQQSLKEMRLLVHEMRPSQLEKEGLAAALQARLDTVERHSGIRARYLVELEQKLSPQVQLQYYRVAEEALNNALKHAAASAVRVHIRSGGGVATMEISDNGKGFDPAEMASSRGMGLTNIRERMEKLGGCLEVDSTPGKGTTIRVYMDIGNETHGK